MARRFGHIGDDHRAFILRQHVFFTASAAPGARVNLSPRSTDSLRVLDPGMVAYLDRTGSGNETAAHLRAGGRLTIMLCAFAGPPSILCLYGAGRVVHRASVEFDQLIAGAFAGKRPLGTRQIVVLDVDLVQTSCGFGVPLFAYEGERPALDRWAEAKGADGLAAYQRTTNVLSMDGLPTGLFEPEPSAVPTPE